MLQISFIIIEYHSIQDVTECAASITRTCGDISHEIIVSSNSTYSEEERAILIDTHPVIQWVFNTVNGGFAYGMNCGLAKSAGDIVVITNPDVRIQSENIADAISFLQINKQVGLIGPQIIDTIGAIQDTCRPFMSPSHFLRRIPQRIFKGKDVLLEKGFNYKRPQAVDWVIGAFMMVRRDALKKVGGLDEEYFLYIEDMDWCMRFWKNNLQVVYYPDLQVEYKGDRKSTSTITKRKFVNRYMYYHFKSYIRFLMKFGLNPQRPSIC